MIDEVGAKRVDKAVSNLDVAPVDLLMAMAADIRDGKIEVDGLVLCYAHRPRDAAWTYGSYRCGVTKEGEITTLVMVQEQVIRKWREGG